MGGPEAVEAQRARGKLTARERLEALFDPGSFRELDLLVEHRCHRFGMDRTRVAADGVITGWGTVEGRPVFAFAQDFTSLGGTLGEMHAAKICKVMDLAVRARAPLVGLNDSGGARIQEGVDALSGYGRIFFRNARASGLVPQISVIMGPTAGGAVYSPAMTDWVIMVRRTSYMFITGPRVVEEVTGQRVSLEELGGAEVHAIRSGVAHFLCEDDREALALVRRLLGYLPSHCEERPPRRDLGDDPHREVPELEEVLPDNPRQVYDMRRVLRALVDRGELLEVHARFAPNIITAFARLEGETVGLVANQPFHLGGCLDVDASDKAARFVRFCDAFNIPLVTLADVPGYLPGTAQEHAGIIRHGAKLLWSYSEATVPKVTVIVRKAYGGAYLAMCSRELGADFVFAWPTAEIAVMGAEAAVNVLYRRELAGAKDPEALRARRAEEYRAEFYNPWLAAARGYVDAVIRPRETRRRLIEALRVLRDKREPAPRRKHGNIPL